MKNLRNTIRKHFRNYKPKDVDAASELVSDTYGALSMEAHLRLVGKVLQRPVVEVSYFPSTTPKTISMS